MTYYYIEVSQCSAGVADAHVHTSAAQQAGCCEAVNPAQSAAGGAQHLTLLSLSLQVCVALAQDTNEFMLLSVPVRQEVTFAQEDILQRRQSPMPFPADEQAPQEELPGPPPDPPKQDRPSRSKGRLEAQPSENGAQPSKAGAGAPADYHELAEEVCRKLCPSLDCAMQYPYCQRRRRGCECK